MIRFWQSHTLRLAASYLAIIMVLSIGFSIILYQVSSDEIGRQVPPSYNRFYEPPNLELREFFEHRVNEGRLHLRNNLVLLNLFVLITGSGISYLLARRSLRPIEEAMEAQGQFITNASHELRTPLTAILAENEVALRRPGLNLSRAKKIIEDNTEEITKLKELTDGLLNLAKNDNHIAPKSVAIQEVVSSATTNVLKLAQAKQVSIDDQSSNITVLAETDKLTQVMTILFENAIKYGKANSTVYVSAQPKGKAGVIQVRDEGPGIAKKDIPHIFDRFYRGELSRSSRKVSGYGLGLSIAQQIIISYGGEISVTSTMGKGSTFTIKLPLG